MQVNSETLKGNTMSEEMNGTTLYQRVGGEAAIQAAVDRFYERVLADPALSHFFTETSMPRLKAHQFAFLSQALGGPKQYSGPLMRDAHSKLAIEQRHFDSVAIHLVETLRELGVPEDIIGKIAAALTPLSGQIVNTPMQGAVV
jgi:hemoglobin